MYFWQNYVYSPAGSNERQARRKELKQKFWARSKMDSQAHKL